ncbi:MAG: ABC transporter ATP-binding protein [Acidobacteria bacterium]|jgi:putative ABC transport system ATP-binding protein|nr:ABC transporter ATP-binding protein [Acidobacteriota bacterium]
MLRAQDLSRHYVMGASLVKALDGLTLTIAEGEFVALLGTSGSGKSTLLNLVGGLDQPTSGALHVGGRDLATLTRDELSLHRRHTVGMIFQSFNLVPTMTAAENVSLSLMFAGVPRAERLTRATALLESMGLGGRQHHRPKELSGGEQQRVAVARALANQPPLLLADEPTGNLDSRTSTEIMNLIQTLNERDGKTVVIVTHDAALAARYARRTVTMLDGHIISDTAA